MKKTLAEHCARTTKESSVESEIRTLLELNGWRTHKIDVMRGVTVDYGARGKRRFSEGTPGQPDLIAMRPSGFGWSVGCTVLYIECKRPRGGNLSKAQEAMHGVLREEGYPVIVARSWRDVVEQARDCFITVERRKA